MHHAKTFIIQNQNLCINKKNKGWDKRLKRIFSNVKNFDNSIFLVHDPPLNHLDKVLFKNQTCEVEAL